jgi:hypothetical protein
MSTGQIVLFVAFFAIWQMALAVWILSLRDRRWRLSIALVFALTALVALILGMFVIAMRMDPS